MSKKELSIGGDESGDLK